MARIRSVKPEFWDDRKLARRTSRDARLLYIGLWNFADEHAREPGDPATIKGKVFPYDDDIGVPEIRKLLDELAELGRVIRYEDDGDPYLFLPTLHKHQRLETAKVPSRYPAPPDDDFALFPASDIPGADESAPRADRSAPRADESAPFYVAGSMEHVAGSRDAPPARRRATRLPDDFTVTPEMVDWARSKCPHVDGGRETEKFVNYWTAASGKNAAKLDWAATWRNWMLNAEERAPRGAPAVAHRSTTNDRVQAALAAGERVQAELDRRGGAR